MSANERFATTKAGGGLVHLRDKESPPDAAIGLKRGPPLAQQPDGVMNTLTTSFVKRLRDRDEAAWFELWETFGPVLRGQLAKWGRGRIGVETVRDLTQETLAALSDSIDRYDPSRGARFSTWLLSIAKHALGDEIDRRMALKRGGGRKPTEFDERFMGEAATIEADAAYEQSVFRAKVYAAIRKTETEAEFMPFQVYRMRVFDGMPGKDVAVQLGVSEPTVSRYLQRIRELLRRRLAETIATYSFTAEEQEEARRAGLGDDDVMFDDGLRDIYYKQSQLLTQDETAASEVF